MLTACHLLGRTPIAKRYRAPRHVLKPDVRCCCFERAGLYCLLNLVAQVAERLSLPSRRHTVGDPRAFMAGKSQANEPFGVEQACRILQESHSAAVVLDQIV